MAIRVSSSMRRYQEAAGLRATQRRPSARRAPAKMAGHFVPLAYPLPMPHLHLDDAGSPAPDRADASVWPNGLAAENG